jgi:hypothetical protein
MDMGSNIDTGGIITLVVFGAVLIGAVTYGPGLIEQLKGAVPVPGAVNPGVGSTIPTPVPTSGSTPTTAEPAINLPNTPTSPSIVPPTGTANSTACKLVYNGKCDTECKNASSAACIGCKQVCGGSANVAYSYYGEPVLEFSNT